MLVKEKPDVYYCSNGLVETHAQIAIDAASEKSHVIVEKPMHCFGWCW